VAIEARDERFLEFAVASGVLDGSRSHDLWSARKADTVAEPIEAFVVRRGFLSRDDVERITRYARDGGTVADARVQTLAGETPIEVTVADSSDSKGVRLAQWFGPYEIVNEIARGGMGAVYRAKKTGSSEVVALKVLLDEKDPPEATVRRFDREIRAGREIDHPNVVKVHDAGSIDGRLYFTMELVDGRSFEKLFGELPLRIKVIIFAKIARAVQAAHARGYIHRDLKPQNILVTEDLEPKVADFGLAKSLDRESRLTKTGAILGTLAYMSPEQAQGGGFQLDVRTDVYALGAILYHIITGDVPFRGETNYGTIGLILAQDPDPPWNRNPDCPRELGAIALKALEKEPEKRFQTAQEVAEEVERWLQGSEVVTHAPTLGARAAKWFRRRKLPILASVLIVAVAIGTRGLLSWKRARDHEAHLAAMREVASALLAELAQPEPKTSVFADRLDGLLLGLKDLPELANERRAIEGAALVARSLDVERPPEEACPLLEAALAAAPVRWDVRRACASALVRFGEPERAIELLVQSPAQTPEVLELLGQTKLEIGDLVGARTTLERAGDHARPLLARALVLAGDPRGLELARSLQPSDENVLLVQEARLATEPGEAIDAARMLERSRKTPEVALGIARLLLRAERGEEAFFAFDRARRAKADEVACLAGRAEAELLLGRANEACVTLDEAAKRLKAHRGFRLARLLARRSEIQRFLAKTPPRETLDARPNDPALKLAVLGDALSLADLEAAARELGTRPQAVAAWCALARARAKTGDEGGAAAAVKEALAVDPSSDEALAFDKAKACAAFLAGTGDGARLYRASLVAQRVANAWTKPGERERARTLLDLAVNAAPWAGAPRVERGRRIAGEGNAAAAAPEIERGIALSGDDAAGLVVLAESAEPARREALAARALAIDPANARALALRGKACLDQGRADEAVAFLASSVKTDHHDAAAWEWDADALDKVGKPSKDARTEAALRRDWRKTAEDALRDKDFLRALDYAPEDPKIVYLVIDACFRGDTALEDVYLRYAHMVAREPRNLNGIFERNALESISPDLAASYEGKDAGVDELWTGFFLRSIKIIRDHDLGPESMRRARVLLERCLSKDPGLLVAVGSRAFILALEKQTELAKNDIDRVSDVAISHEMGVSMLGYVLVDAQSGSPDLKQHLQELGKLDHSLHVWALQLTAQKGP